MQGGAFDRVVYGPGIGNGLLELGPTARLKVVVDSAEELVPVCLDEREQAATVNVVKLMAVYPIIV